MVSEDRIHLLARIAGTLPETEANAVLPRSASILALAAAAYGSRPDDDSTFPTGFDPQAAVLFEAIVEGAYLVASADGVFDEAERQAFERIVTAACGGTVPQRHIEGLVADLSDQLAEDGLDRRIERVSEPIRREEHAQEVLRIAALVARSSEDVSDVERSVLERLAKAFRLDPSEIDAALADVDRALSVGA